MDDGKGRGGEKTKDLKNEDGVSFRMLSVLECAYCATAVCTYEGQSSARVCRLNSWHSSNDAEGHEMFLWRDNHTIWSYSFCVASVNWI